MFIVTQFSDFIYLFLLILANLYYILKFVHLKDRHNEFPYVFLMKTEFFLDVKQFWVLPQLLTYHLGTQNFTLTVSCQTSRTQTFSMILVVYSYLPKANAQRNCASKTTLVIFSVLEETIVIIELDFNCSAHAQSFSSLIVFDLNQVFMKLAKFYSQLARRWIAHMNKATPEIAENYYRLQ